MKEISYIGTIMVFLLAAWFMYIGVTGVVAAYPFFFPIITMVVVVFGLGFTAFLFVSKGHASWQLDHNGDPKIPVAAPKRASRAVVKKVAE